MNRSQPAPPITPAQGRAARHALGWTNAQACAAAGIAPNTLGKFEGGGEVRASVADRLRAALEAAGVTFAPDGRGVSW